MTLSNLHFFHLGMDLMGVSHKKTNKSNNPRLFITYFGTTPDVCLVVWNMLQNNWNKYTNNPRPIHFLWAFRFMKNYNDWESHAAEVGGKDSKTFRKWVWFYVEGISLLISKVVSTCAKYFIRLCTLLIALLCISK